MRRLRKPGVTTELLVGDGFVLLPAEIVIFSRNKMIISATGAQPEFLLGVHAVVAASVS